MAERKILEEFELSDGRKIKVYEGKAKDLIAAQRMAGNPDEAIFGVLHILLEVDGKRLPLEEWRELDIPSFMEVVSRVIPLLGLSRMTLPGISLPSQGRQAGASEN